ncbi:eEF1A lysine and N-terminal methyltransferase homolog [Episyrphus balteatus]|uniref:eEF1A lysine and N-terminal methyltransferase homolog n=1 Tax=Episyrphus balteatus TaxID=286459 RepID=UPI002485B128|nr:eEF1A lysine and N-terminal methyltransferase homolog [Episyrphus balteatus]XP_055859086.1 eEF1A lysine and N-terminal methyltransferase homolog [Episyrphus balteatus]XP_055859087.1 eEF1A lysine and N-terminal methyltransferase homolog [Episyrphus balteatus]
MDLLPKSHHEFNQTEYWNTFFKKRGTKAFEWYGEYLNLVVQIHKYVKYQDKILMVGCGNSRLSMDMYDSGFKDITNIDISPVAIKKMIEMNGKDRSDMKFIQMDATSMSFADETFSVVFDKGTLDALMTDNSEEVRKTVETYFKEILRTLRNGGRYICISLLQEHILDFLLEFFPKNSCMFRVVRCFETEQCSGEGDSDSLSMPVFAVVATKFKALPQTILEVCMGGEKMIRVTSTDEVVAAVTSTQNAAMICNGLARSNIVGLNEVTMDLYKPGESNPRYTLYISDQPPARNNGKYAAFIVPQGREIEWLFSTPQGRKKLLESAKYNRLAIVTMHRDQEYDSWESVESELSESVRNLAPKGLTDLIPYLSLGKDVGKRETLVCGFSTISGDFRIEEVEGQNGKVFRRLIFLSNQNVVQSEALLKTIKTKNKSRTKIDVGYLACQHHLFMTVGVQMATMGSSSSSGDDSSKNVLVVGLGGGGLCTFIRAALTNVSVTAVEIDPIMLEVAEQYFELKQDKRLHVVIDDGVAFVNRCKEKAIQFDAVLFDVDSKDISLGMSCPPPNFLEPEILESLKYVIGPKGMFILNLVCRDEQLREQAVSNLNKVFTSCCCYKLDEDVNEVIYCTNDEKYKNLADWKKILGTSSRSLNSIAKESKFSDTDMVDVTDFLNDLKI